MRDTILEGRGTSEPPNAARFSSVAIPGSLLVHIAILMVVSMTAIDRPLPPSALPRSIEVEIVTELEYRDAFELPPKATIAPLVVPQLAEEPNATPPAPADGMKHATELFASGVLADPKNRQVRETLPLLEGTERIVQLCVIEGLEQLRSEKPEPLPDSISAAAFGPSILRGYTLEANDAAYRAAQKWYRLAFACTVAPNFAGVEAYAFKTGEIIPEADWDAHNLIAEDEDE